MMRIDDVTADQKIRAGFYVVDEDIENDVVDEDVENDVVVDDIVDDVVHIVEEHLVIAPPYLTPSALCPN